MEFKHVCWIDTQLRLPDSAVNLAHTKSGATVGASACVEGFQASGVINGNKSLVGWGKGNGWQGPSPIWHPNWWGEWVEVDFEDAKLIDTIIVYTFPAFVNGRFWRGLKDFQVQYLDEGKRTK